MARRRWNKPETLFLLDCHVPTRVHGFFSSYGKCRGSWDGQTALFYMAARTIEIETAFKLYTRTLAGEFIVVNRHLMNKLTQLQLWNDSMRQAIIAANGTLMVFPLM